MATSSGRLTQQERDDLRHLGMSALWKVGYYIVRRKALVCLLDELESVEAEVNHWSSVALERRAEIDRLRKELERSTAPASSTRVDL